MKLELKEIPVGQFFKVKSGSFHAKKELESGNIPLVSCGDTNNGVIGYYDILGKDIYERAITCAYNGQPLTAKFHPYKFGAKDDVAVLIPQNEMNDITLIYVAAMLNRMQWRYSYGRKCFREKMKLLKLPVPVIEVGDQQSIDEKTIEALFSYNHVVRGLMENTLQKFFKLES
jgi:type I restriction enzyme M protein